MRKILSVFLVVVTLCCMLCVGVSAQTYSTVYPSVYNSGSPLWLHCNLQGYGDYVILLDPNTNLQSFGFDAPTGYNLINNTASTINGRGYSTSSTDGYLCRWLTYYCLQFRIPNGNNSYTWTDVHINEIYGTTLNLIDYTGDRGNDLYKNDIPENQVNIVICACLVALVLLFVCSMVFKPKLFRM